MCGKVICSIDTRIRGRSRNEKRGWKANVDHEPMTGIWGRRPKGERSPLKLKAF